MNQRVMAGDAIKLDPISHAVVEAIRTDQMNQVVGGEVERIPAPPIGKDVPFDLSAVTLSAPITSLVINASGYVVPPEPAPCEMAAFTGGTPTGGAETGGFNPAMFGD
jgi:hypothetical protein